MFNRLMPTIAVAVASAGTKKKPPNTTPTLRPVALTAAVGVDNAYPPMLSRPGTAVDVARGALHPANAYDPVVGIYPFTSPTVSVRADSPGNQWLANQSHASPPSPFGPVAPPSRPRWHPRSAGCKAAAVRCLEMAQSA